MYEQGAQQGQISSIGGSRLSAPTPTASIAAALDANDKLLADLHNTISQLSDRLALMLAPDPPAGNATGKDVGSPQIVDRVSFQGTAIAIATQRLQYLMQRIQL